jgi:hypothetical protein
MHPGQGQGPPLSSSLAACLTKEVQDWDTPQIETELVEVRKVASEIQEDGTSSARSRELDLKFMGQRRYLASCGLNYLLLAPEPPCFKSDILN